MVTWSFCRLFILSTSTRHPNNRMTKEARSQRPLPSLCFLGRSEKQDGRPGLWLAETFSTSPLKPLNGIQWNMTGSKISMSSTKFVFFRSISIQKWPSWSFCQKGGTLYSGVRYVALWASCWIIMLQKCVEGQTDEHRDYYRVPHLIHSLFMGEQWWPSG